MSTYPYWEPASIKRKTLPTELKYPIASELMDQDGSLGGEITLTKQHILFLKGLTWSKNPGVCSGAHALINGIETHGSIRFFLED